MKKKTRYYGCKPDKSDNRDFVFSAKLSKVQLPPSIDMSGKCGPVRNQGNLGACTGFGCSGSMEMFSHNIHSPLWVYYKERQKEGTISEDTGASVRDGLKVMKSLGCTLESDWPYNVGKFSVKPPEKADSQAKSYMLESYNRAVGLQAAKECLFNGSPLVIGMAVYTSFESEQTQKSGVVSTPKEAEQLLGYHCVLVAGYYDNPNFPGGGYFYCKNSWGESWGINGWFKLPYEYFLSYVPDVWSIKFKQEQTYA